MKIAVYPGSFDPITNGHLDIIKRASKIFDKVIVLIAINPNKKTRFNIPTRIKMIVESVKDIKNVKVDYTKGLTVNYCKKNNAKFIVRGIRNKSDFVYENNLCEAYHKQDNSIGFVLLSADKNLEKISSTKIENLVKQNKDISKYVPNSVVKEYKKRLF